jgi:hypothetical protein
MANHRQLALAWRMYAEDYNDRITRAYGPGAWIQGILDFNGGNNSNWDVEVDIKKSPLAPYCSKNYDIFKCPADKSQVNVRGRWMPRVRSMAMNNWVGGNGNLVYNARGGQDNGWSGPEWRVYQKLGDMKDPGPVKTFVFLDEREDSINDGFWVTEMTGYPNQPSSWRIIDYPASYHNLAGGFSFADGHSEIKKWKDPRTVPVLKKGQPLPLNQPSPNNLDVFWCQERATRRVQ